MLRLIVSPAKSKPAILRIDNEPWAAEMVRMGDIAAKGRNL